MESDRFVTESPGPSLCPVKPTGINGIFFLVFLLMGSGCLVPGTLEASRVVRGQGFDFRAPVQLAEAFPVGEGSGMPAPYLIDNEGIFVTDYNGDYRPDLLLTGPKSPVLYWNTGDSFRRVASFPELDVKISYAVRVDYNVDGWWDFVLIPRRGRIILLKNDDGTFEVDRRLPAPTLNEGVGATTGDYDRDGCPDLFVIQYNNTTDTVFRRKKLERLGARFDEVESDNGRRNFLLKGDCTTFRVKQDDVFVREHWSLATSFFDATGDGRPDIHVANDFYRDSLYLNEGGGEFTHRYLDHSTDRNGMSSQVLEVNRDGNFDLFVSNILMPEDSRIWSSNRFTAAYTVNPHGHNLLINGGEGTFKDRADSYGVREGGWGWSITWSDFDNDYEMELLQAKQNFLIPATAVELFNIDKFDIASFVGNYEGFKPIPEGAEIDPDIRSEFHEWLGYPGFWDQPNGTFRRSREVEKDFGRLNARGIVSLDYNVDGRLDLAVSQYDAPFKLFANETDSGNHWVKIALRPLHSQGRLRIRAGGETRYLPVNSRTDFQSQESPYYHLGLGDQGVIDRITMEWSDGTERSFTDVRSNQFLVVSKNGPLRRVVRD